MSTEQQTQAVSDDSGPVSPQTTDRTEWPKRLRALTADELDRLTIDRDGRMFWDGKPVNVPEKGQVMTTDTAGKKTGEGDMAREAIDMLDQAAADLAGPKAATATGEDADDDETATTQASADDETADTGTDVAPIVQQRALEVAKPKSFTMHASAGELVRLSLTPMQTVAMVFVSVALFAAAVGIAANGYVAVNEWGCRVGWIKNYCPPERLHPSLSARIAD